MSYISQILKLNKMLWPTGRAWRQITGSWLDTLMRGLALSENQAYTDMLSPLDAILPDNPRFTADDATDWERRLGLITNTAVPLADRMAAIRRKMNHPGTIKARQHYLYVQSQLRAANFDVFCYENRFPDGSGGYITQDPITLAGGGGTAFQHNDHQHGDAQHGGAYQNLVANYIDEALDATFDVGANLRSTFFIGGVGGAGTFATVPLTRKAEFRQLILRLKPVQTVAYLFIVYN